MDIYKTSVLLQYTYIDDDDLLLWKLFSTKLYKIILKIDFNFVQAFTNNYELLILEGLIL